MDENISEMLKSVMSDPETMSKLMSVAEGLTGGSEKPSPQVETPEKEVSAVPSILTKGNEERIALISAIRPYLSPERRKSADSMIKMLKMMKLTDLSKMLGNL
ncbi:MAG: hypothetical protein J6D09_04315 [Clostridia bacterium]|nr:hypothetical protein [Clostridia bacterium]